MIYLALEQTRLFWALTSFRTKARALRPIPLKGGRNAPVHAFPNDAQSECGVAMPPEETGWSTPKVQDIPC